MQRYLEENERKTKFKKNKIAYLPPTYLGQSMG